MNIVVIGSSNTDMIIKVPRIPKPGETILGGTFSTAAGGKGANQAVAAARAGGNVTFVARVGDDMFGNEAIKGFKDDGINVDYVIKDKTAPSGVAEIFVADDGENSIAVASGANANLSPADVGKAESVIANADIVIMQLETPVETIEAAAGLAHENGVKVILNPAPAQPLPDNLLKLINVLTPNESEAELLTGIQVTDTASAKIAAEKLHQKGIPMVIITMGASGVYASAPEFTGPIPGFKVKAVDTTAAGDVFNGALAVAMAGNQPLTGAIRFANAAAAISVTQLGAQPSAPGRETIDNFLKQNK
ncbi:ribokinase [candidate division KSB1 bacterium]|nr:ribokinase [candidate division KSB1 bacterium]